MASVDQVRRLLARVRNEKLYSRQPDEAIRLAREAMKLADTDVWRALACYRLAHLLMRLEPPALEEADQRMAHAANEPGLGPLPAIYRLALLARRGADAKEIAACFDLAKKRLRALDDGSVDLRPVNTTTRANDFVAFVNDGVFNMLELATLFLRLPYKEIHGLGSASNGDGSAFEDLGLPNTWYLFTNLDDRESSKYPELLARTEAMQLRDQQEDDVYVFRLPCAQQAQVLEDDKWVAYSEEPAPKELGLLALTLAGRAKSDDDMRRHYGYDDEGNRAFNQIVHRARTRVRATLNVQDNLIVHRGAPWLIDDDIKMIALVEEGALPLGG